METYLQKRERLEAANGFSMYTNEGACLSASLFLPSVTPDDPAYSARDRRISVSICHLPLGPEGSQTFSFSSGVTVSPEKARELATMLVSAADVLDNAEELRECA